jgi:hypothetical protein
LAHTYNPALRRLRQEGLSSRLAWATYQDTVSTPSPQKKEKKKDKVLHAITQGVSIDRKEVQELSWEALTSLGTKNWKGKGMRGQRDEGELAKSNKKWES